MAIRIGEVKSSSLSDDKKEVIIGGAGKYIGDVELRFARECLDDLIDALVRAKAAFADARSPPLPLERFDHVGLACSVDPARGRGPGVSGHRRTARLHERPGVASARAPHLSTGRSPP